MKRTIVSLILISLFVCGVVIFDVSFMTNYAKRMNELLDQVENAADSEAQKDAALQLDAYFEKQNFCAHRFVPTGMIDEIETLLYKLNAYISTNDEHEICATISEIRSKVNSLYSTSLYRWYHPPEFRIE